MALEEILYRIAKEAEKEEKAIIEQSENEARKILDDARAKALSIRASYELKAREDAETARRQKVSSATLEGRSYLEQEREKVENNYLEVLKSKIVELRTSEDYLDYLHDAIVNAKKVLGQDSIVYLDKNDAKKMQERGITSIQESGTIDPLGGAIVTSRDGKMIVDLTLSEIVRNRGDKIRKIIRDHING